MASDVMLSSCPLRLGATARWVASCRIRSASCQLDDSFHVAYLQLAWMLQTRAANRPALRIEALPSRSLVDATVMYSSV